MSSIGDMTKTTHEENPYVPSKALYHLERLQSLRKNELFSPTLLQVDPMAYCNDNCKFCSYREETMYNNTMLKLIDSDVSEVKDHAGGVGKPTEKGTWPEWMADSLPSQMVAAGIPAIEITGGGEPTLWKGFDKLVRNLLGYRRDVGIVTNGSNISDERAKLMSRCTWIRISMDAATAETHRAVHRTAIADFDRRILNIRKLVSYKLSQKTDCTIGVSFVVQPENFGEMEQAARLYRDLGVEYVRFSVMYDKVGDGKISDKKDLFPGIIDHLKKNYDTESFKVLFDTSRLWTYTKPNTDFKKCYIQYFVWSIGADCNVYPCCIVKYDPKFAFASILDKTLSQIIQDANFQASQNGLDVGLCPPCWLRERNMSIAQTQDIPKHHNFL